MSVTTGQNYPNQCFCGHDSTLHSATQGGAKSGSPGNCTVCPDAHAFSPDFVLGKSPFYSTSVLGSSQI